MLNVCSNAGVWTQRTFLMGPDRTWFKVNDDGYPTDPTYMLVDDVSVQ